MTSKKIIITGANGFLGSNLANYFQAKGWQVVGLVRDPQKMPKDGVKYLKYELGQKFDWSTLKDADYLVHTAYIKYSRRQPAAYNQNIKGAKDIMAAARVINFKKNIYIS